MPCGDFHWFHCDARNGLWSLSDGYDSVSVTVVFAVDLIGIVPKSIDGPLESDSALLGNRSGVFQDHPRRSVPFSIDSLRTWQLNHSESRW